MTKSGLLLCIVLLMASGGRAAAEASGPDFWRVHGVASDDRLNVHDGPSARSKIVGNLAPNATGLKNLGCRNDLSFNEWQRLSPAERARRSKPRWCKVQTPDLTGWVAGRFLAEGAAPEAGAHQTAVVRAWTIACRPQGCTIEQTAIGSKAVTRLVITPVQANARISIIRSSLPRKGTLSIFADGEQLSAGPMAQLTRQGKTRASLEPDDVTAGLLRGMRRHKTMVIGFPGEERGVEFHVDGFAEAWAVFERLKDRQGR